MVFINNVYVVIFQTNFSGGRCCKKVPVQRFVFFCSGQKMAQGVLDDAGAYVLLRRGVSDDRRGWVIKRYSCYHRYSACISHWKIRIFRSLGDHPIRKMMKRGWSGSAFCCSNCRFIGWYILDLVSSGCAGFCIPIHIKWLRSSEYYTQLRSQAEGGRNKRKYHILDRCLSVREAG